jgi:hypothetical protein
MRNRQLRWTAGGIAVLAVAAVAFGERGTALAGDRDHGPRDLRPEHYSGLLNDHTPSAAIVRGGPYEMRGKWSLELDERRGKASFSAAMDMQTSDYGITQGTVNKDDPTTRGAHTHHISMTDGVFSTDWASQCPVFSPATTNGFVITGMAFVTGNGSPAPFGNLSPLTVCVLGGESVQYSNVTVTIGAPASSHFGTQAIHGVVLKCRGRFLRQSRDCSLEQ